MCCSCIVVGLYKNIAEPKGWKCSQWTVAVCTSPRVLQGAFWNESGWLLEMRCLMCCKHQWFACGNFWEHDWGASAGSSTKQNIKIKTALDLVRRFSIQATPNILSSSTANDGMISDLTRVWLSQKQVWLGALALSAEHRHETGPDKWQWHSPGTPGVAWPAPAPQGGSASPGFTGTIPHRIFIGSPGSSPHLGILHQTIHQKQKLYGESGDWYWKQDPNILSCVSWVRKKFPAQ